MNVKQTVSADAYIREHWPKNVPEDCTRLDKHEDDCRTRGDARPCRSCRTFDRLDLKARKVLGLEL